MKPQNNNRIFELQKRITSLGDPKKGWHGPGTAPPSDQAIENAMRVISLLPEKILTVIDSKDINCTPHGTIWILIETRTKLLRIEMVGDGIRYIHAEGESQGMVEDIDAKAFVSRRNTLDKLMRALDKLNI